MISDVPRPSAAVRRTESADAGRLPDWCRARHYDLELDVDLDRGRYDGWLRLELELREASDHIVLHCAGPRIGEVSALQRGERAPGVVVADAASQIITITFARALSPGPLKLRVAFSAEMRSGMRGFYRAELDARTYASTQFEPAEARTAFPCLDEPDQKATFQLALITRGPETVLSNAPLLGVHESGGRRRTIFAQTRPVPPFLMAWALGPFVSTNARLTTSGCPIRVWLPHTLTKSAGALSLEAHVVAVNWLEAYFGEPCPVPKLDAVGVPQLGAGAMENPGLFTYRLVAIAGEAATTSLAAEQAIVSVAAHECVHLWFGDLVTIRWWDDLWLAEAMATFLATKLTAELHPEWHPWALFQTRLESAFALDELPSSHPVATAVTDVASTRYQFDAITYAKGAGILRMLESWVGAERFRNGLRSYIQTHRDGTAGRSDLWSALAGTADVLGVPEIADAWCAQPGHPTVTIRPVPGRRDLAAIGRLQVGPHAGPSLVPLTIAHGRGAARQETKLLVRPEPRSVSVGDVDWVVPNPATVGFLRTSDPLAWVRRSAAALSLDEQVGLIWDGWASVRQGRALPSELCALLPTLTAGAAVSLNAVLSICRWLDANVPAARTLARDVARQIFAPISARSQKDPPTSRDAVAIDALATQALGRLVGDDRTLRACEEAAERWRSGQWSGAADTLAAVLITAAAREDAPLLGACLDRLDATPDPQVRSVLLRAAAAFRAPALVARVIDHCFTTLPPQDRPTLLDLFLREPGARDQVADALLSRWSSIEELDPVALDRITGSLAHVVIGPASSRVDAFLGARAGSDVAARRSLERLQHDRATAERITRAIEQESRPPEERAGESQLAALSVG